MRTTKTRATAKALVAALMLSASLQNVMGAENPHEHEIDKYFTINQTGNIMYSSTLQDEKAINDQVLETFQKVTVFFGALTAAIRKADRDLFDFEAVSTIIEKSQFFVLEHEEEREYERETTSIQLNTDIIGDVLGVSLGGGSLRVAQRVLATLGKANSGSANFRATQSKGKKDIAHLLFVCEYLMGAPLVSIQLFKIHEDQLAQFASSPCSKASRSKIHLNYTQKTYLFVDPKFIEKFSHEFKHSDAHDELVTELHGYLKDMP